MSSDNPVVSQEKIQEKIIIAWKKVLKREELGLSADFFENGGDSLKSVQIASLLKKEGIQVKATDILRNPTIASLVAFVGKQK